MLINICLFNTLFFLYRTPTEELSKKHVMLKRSASLPQIHGGENLMEELGISKDIRIDRLSEQEVKLLKKQNARNAQVCL